ncbi:MAG TPA: recombination regulator RecX [Usitatibacter sp.]
MAWAFVAKTEPSLRARAMRFLARREHSRAELQRKLSAVAEEGDDVEALLDELASRGWLSDTRFAELAVRSKARRFGPLKVAHQLRTKGVGEDTIAIAFASAGTDGTANLERVWRSHFSAAPADQRERGRQVRFLQGRGFPLDDILRFLKGMRT